LALNALSLMTSNYEDYRQEIVDFFNKKYNERMFILLYHSHKRSLDKTLELMNDRELQFSILQIALFHQNNIKFDCPRLCALFKSISAKNFSQVWFCCFRA